MNNKSFILFQKNEFSCVLLINKHLINDLQFPNKVNLQSTYIFGLCDYLGVFIPKNVETAELIESKFSLLSHKKDPMENVRWVKVEKCWFLIFFVYTSMYIKKCKIFSFLHELQRKNSDIQTILWPSSTSLDFKPKQEENRFIWLQIRNSKLLLNRYSKRGAMVENAKNFNLTWFLKKFDL